MTTARNLDISGWTQHATPPTFDGLYPSSTRPVISTGYKGIPDPNFGAPINDPRFYVSPADPGAWPSAEAANNYYVDNTHGSATDTLQGGEVADVFGNRLGYPDLPRLTYLTTLPAGANMVITGGPYTGGQQTFDFQGTVTQPVFFRGLSTAAAPLMRRDMRFQGTFYFMEDLEWDTNNIPRFGYWTTKSNNVCFRNNVGTGPGTAAGANAFCGMSGALGNLMEKFVAYKNTIHDFGDSLSATENDFHGILPSSYAEDTWVLENTIYNMGGDSIQIGQANFTDVERPKRTYVARNTFHDDRENAIDIKRSLDTICSENVCYGYAGTSTSSGEVIVIHNAADQVWILFNDVYDGEFGIITTESTNTWFIGNKISNIHRVGGVGDVDSGYTAGACIHLRNAATTGGVVANTLSNYDLGIQLTQGGAAGYICESNILKDRTAATGYDIRCGESDIRTGSSLNNNLIHHASGDAAEIKDEGNVAFTPTAWNTANSNMANTIEADPLLVSVGTRDFHIGAGSPAIDAGLKSSPYATFFTRYGISIETDYDGVALPALSTDVDAGAFQRVA